MRFYFKIWKIEITFNLGDVSQDDDWGIYWSDDAEAYVCNKCMMVFEPINPAGFLSTEDLMLLGREHRCGNLG